MFKRPLTQLPQLQALAICASGCLLAASSLTYSPWAAVAVLGGVGVQMISIGREPDKDEVEERMPH